MKTINNQPIPKFSCTLQRGKLSLDVAAELNIVTARQHFASNERAIRAAQMSVQQMMRKGWKLVKLNGEKVRQGKIIIAKSPLAYSKIEKANPLRPNTRLPLGDGTVGREE